MSGAAQPLGDGQEDSDKNGPGHFFSAALMLGSLYFMHLLVSLHESVPLMSYTCGLDVTRSKTEVLFEQGVCVCVCVCVCV